MTRKQNKADDKDSTIPNVKAFPPGGYVDNDELLRPPGPNTKDTHVKNLAWGTIAYVSLA